MKKIVLRVDGLLSKKEYKKLGKKYHLLVSRTRNSIILLAAVSKTIKGKLGFNMNTSDEKFLFNSQAIFTAITADAGGFYTPAFGKLALLNSQNILLSKAIDKVRQKGVGSEGAKNTIKKKVFNTLGSALGYINDLAKDDQTNAVAIITGAKMEVIKEAARNKQDFAVMFGDATEEIKLYSLAVKINGKYVPATYMWQYSIDDGKTWEDLEPTLISKTVATGMLVNVPTKFRKRTKTTQNGLSAWCTPIEITPR